MSSDRRAEARRQQREARKRTTTRLVGDGIVAQAIGHHYRATGGAELPAKVPGKHRWVASTTYVLDDESARDVVDDNARHLLGPDRLMMLAAWCWDCERPLSGLVALEAGAAAWDSWCPAPADD